MAHARRSVNPKIEKRGMQMGKEIKTIRQLKQQLQNYDPKLLISIVDEETGYSTIQWVKEKGLKKNVLYQWIKLVATHSCQLSTVEEFIETLHQFPEQMIVTIRNQEGHYSRLFLVVEEMNEQKWLMIVDDLTYQRYYKENEIDYKNQALDKMLDEMKKKHSDTEDAIHSWLCNQEEEQLFQGVLKKGRTIKGAVSYCLSKAQKQAGTNHAAMISDATVFSWVREYFLLEKIEEHSVQGTVKPSKRKEKKGKKEMVVDGQVSLFGDV